LSQIIFASFSILVRLKALTQVSHREIRQMQIQRFDNMSSTGTPRSVRTAAPNSNEQLQGSLSRENEAEGVVGGDELESLSRQLDGISDVRTDVVEAAKVRVQRGDYLTRAAAEKTAAAILGKDA
jgi:hypothetical protein